MGWSKENKFFGRRKNDPHGWHAHPRRKRLTDRRKRQAREINRQYREFGKKICQEAWRKDAASQYRRLLLEVRPDLKSKGRVVESDDEPLSELKIKIELEKLIEGELQAERAQGASKSCPCQRVTQESSSELPNEKQANLRENLQREGRHIQKLGNRKIEQLD